MERVTIAPDGAGAAAGAWAVAVLLAATLGEALVARPDLPHPRLGLAAALLLTLPLAWSRSRPLLVCWVVAAGFALLAASGVLDPDQTSAPSLTALVALAGAARFCASTRAVAITAVGVCALCGAASGMFDDGPPRLGDLAFGLVFAGGAVALARLVRGGALRQLRLLVELDGERSARAAADSAARHERRRLARELHDLSSHHLVVATLYGQIALNAPDAEAAAEALAVSRTAIDAAGGALTELSGAPPPDGPDGLAPDAQDELARALAQAAALGAHCTVPGAAQLTAVPSGIALTAARIVQEALTNAAKHAPGAAISVALTLGGERLTVEVRSGPAHKGRAAGAGGADATDDERPHLPPASSCHDMTTSERHTVGPHPLRASGGGLGLVGMGERARLLGGSLTFGWSGRSAWSERGWPMPSAWSERRWPMRGARSQPRWIVRARLPLAPARPRALELLRSELRGGAPLAALLAATGLAVWGVAEALGPEGSGHPVARTALAVLAAFAPALLWRRPAVLVAALLAVLAARSAAGSVPATSSPIVLVAALGAFAVAREAASLRGAVVGVAAIVGALPASLLAGDAATSMPDLLFLPALVLGAGAAGLLLRLHAGAAATLGGELARARAAGAAGRAAAVAAERAQLERELTTVTGRALAQARTLVADASHQSGPARAATLTAFERLVAETLADLGRLASVLRRA